MITVSPKQSSEERFLEFDFTNGLGDESIGGVESVAVEKESDGTDMTDSMADPTKDSISTDGKKANVWVQAGDGSGSGNYYVVTCIIQSATTGSILELECRIRVKDIPAS